MLIVESVMSALFNPCSSTSCSLSLASSSKDGWISGELNCCFNAAGRWFAGSQVLVSAGQPSHFMKNPVGSTETLISLAAKLCNLFSVIERLYESNLLFLFGKGFHLSSLKQSYMNIIINTS